MLCSGPHVAMAMMQAGSCSSDSSPSLGTSIFGECSPKPTERQTDRKKERERKRKGGRKEGRKKRRKKNDNMLRVRTVEAFYTFVFRALGKTLEK